MRLAATHLAILGLLGAIVAEVCLQGFQKIPFTCSYLPGKTNIHVTFVFSVMVLLQFLAYCAGLELRAMAHPVQYLTAIAALGGALLFARWRTAAQTDADDIGIPVRGRGLTRDSRSGIELDRYAKRNGNLILVAQGYQVPIRLGDLFARVKMALCRFHACS